MKQFDILIIGAGPAGLSAGLFAARGGAKTAIIENLVAGGQINLTPEIENYPGYMKINGAELGEKMTEQAINAGCKIILDSLVSIDYENKIVTGDEDLYGYKALIISTGASPRKLGVAREQDFIGSGIHFCGLCDGNFYKDKNLIVVGGGNHAVEEAIYLSPIAKSVTMVVDVEKLTAHEATIRQLDKNIKIYFNSKITEILGDKKITGVMVNKETKIETDGIFVAIGRVPNIELAEGKLNLSAGGYITVDAHMQTNLPGVFACGDVIDKPVRQVVTACADGVIAATFANRTIGTL